MYVCFSYFSSSWEMIIQCLVLLRKIAGPSEESLYLYFLNGANLLKFCQKGAWPLLDWLNSKTSPCAMSSVTSYCPALRGSCGGGYEGGVHLFTPREAGAKRARRGCEGKGTRRQCRAQSKRDKEGRWIAKRKHCQYCIWNRHNNTTSSHASTENRHKDIQNGPPVLTFLHIKPEIWYSMIIWWQLNWEKSGIQL